MEELDPYDLLEISPELRPPTHYQLLGIDDFETDLELIAQAAKKRSAYLHQIAAGPHRKVVQQLMGKVAVARRTLLSEQSKQAYDHQLLADTEEYAQQESGDQWQAPSATSAPEKTAKAAEDPAAAQARRRRKSTWDEYKLHLASASVLLLIVGIIWFVNRGSGERRAAEAGAAKSASAAASQDSARRKSSAPPRQAAVQRRSPVRQRPQSPPRSNRPSLAPSFNVDQFLEKDAPGMSKPKPASADPPAGNQANAPGAVKNYAVPAELPSPWQPGIKVLDDFSKKLEQRFRFDKDSTACALENKKLIIKTATSTKPGALQLKAPKLKPGEAVAIDTNLAPGSGQGVQIGLMIGPIRIGLVAGDDQISIRAKNKNQKKSPMMKLGSLSTSATTTLVVGRNSQDPKKLHWLVSSGDSNLTGQIIVKSLDNKPQQLSIFFTSPKAQAKDPVWLDNLRVGPLAESSDWKQPPDVPQL